eukprot:285567-Amphidinium_carterae.1
MATRWTLSLDSAGQDVPRLCFLGLGYHLQIVRVEVAEELTDKKEKVQKKTPTVIHSKLYRNLWGLVLLSLNR